MTTFLQLPPVLTKYASEACWVLWKRAVRKGKTTKPPYQARYPRQHARADDPSTWADFETTLTAYRAGEGDGIGLCLLNCDLAAFDLDDCRDTATGVIEPAACQLIERAHSYVEITASGTGLRILVTGTGPKVHRKQAMPNGNGMTVETYRKCERFIAVTGNALPEATTQLADGDALIDDVVAELDAANENQAKKVDAQAEARPRRHHPHGRARPLQRRSLARCLVGHQRNASARRHARRHRHRAARSRQPHFRPRLRSGESARLRPPPDRAGAHQHELDRSHHERQNPDRKQRRQCAAWPT
jgi:hypothetical protein